MGTRTLVLHLLPESPDAGADISGDGPAGPQVGLVVSKAVGNAVTRNRVKRRLRHLARTRIARLPRTSVLVVRALPGAAQASSTELGADLDTALSRLERSSSAVAASRR